MRKLFVIFLMLVISITVNPVFAYHVYEDPILYVNANWINEPVIATERNGIELLIKDGMTGEPISGLKDKLQVELIFEGHQIQLPMEEDHKNPGRYVSWIVPMLEGDYVLNVLGESGISISHQFKLPTVENISYKRFPTSAGPSKFIPESERNASLIETSQTIKDEIEQIKQMVVEGDNRSIIYVAIGLAIAGIAIGSYALTRKR